MANKSNRKNRPCSVFIPFNIPALSSITYRQFRGNSSNHHKRIVESLDEVIKIHGYKKI